MSNSETPWAEACQVPLSTEFSRQEYCSGWPFPSPGDFPNPQIEPRSPALQAEFLPSELPGRPFNHEETRQFQSQQVTLELLILWVEAKADRKDRAMTQIQVSRFLIHQHITFSGKSTLGKGVRNKEGKLFKSHLLFSRQFLAIRGASGSVLSQLSMAL